MNIKANLYAKKREICDQNVTEVKTGMLYTTTGHKGEGK